MYFYLVNKSVPFVSSDRLTINEVKCFFYYWYGIVVLTVEEITEDEWVYFHILEKEKKM